jgi:Tectonin domain
MFRFAQRFGRHSQERHARARRTRSFNASLEAVEDRTLMSTLSAISWTSGGLQHSATFGIGSNDSVYINEDATGWVSLGGYAQQISAGLNAAGSPEVFAIGSNDALYVNHLDGKGWVGLGGYVKAISATTDNTVFAIGSNDSVYVNSGSGFVSLGGYALQISAGLNAAGSPEVFAIGSNNALYLNHLDGKGWVGLGGYVREIAAPAFETGLSGDVEYAIGENQGGFLYRSGFVSLGGYLQG